MHEGILDYNGNKCVLLLLHLVSTLTYESLASTVAVALWMMEPNVYAPTLDLTIDTILQGGVGRVRVDNPGFTDLR